MKKIIWSIKDIVEILKERQKNEFDGNIAVSGDRGNGKSTLISKIFYRFNIFNPWKHQVYNRKDVIELLKTQKYGLCFDDEAINSSYKRNFQDKIQQELIKIITAYRDNFNIYASAIPNFFSLDKDLRDLYFLHLHVIERGVAVVHMPLQGRLYSQDRWDAKYNAKIEAKWGKRMQSDPKFKPPYHKLTTFRGYLFFNKLTTRQEKLYKEVKMKKRGESFILEEKKEEKTFLDKVYDLLIEGRLTRDGLIQLSLLDGRKYDTVTKLLNKMLKERGIYNKTVKDFIKMEDKKNPEILLHSKSKEELNNLLSGI